MGTDTDQATGQPECSDYRFTAPNHASGLLCCMRALREESNLCDVTLCVAEHEFRVHRLVMAASSPYFNAMFTNAHLETSSSRIELNSVDPEALRSLIDFAYSATLTINQENVQALLATANLLQVMSVREACCEFLMAQIEVENCLGIAAFAEMLSCGELYEASWRFAVENFHEVWRTEEFLSTPTPLLQQLFQSESLHVLCEEEVLECALRWYRQDQDARKEGIQQLLHHIKLPLIPWSVLSEALLSYPSLSSEPHITLLLTNAKDYQSCPKMAEKFLDTPYYAQFLPRKSVGQSQFLYVVGGETTPGRSTVASVERFTPSKGSWTTLAPMATSRRGVGVTFLNRQLYVVGGSDGIQALSTVECYDPQSNSWLRLADMMQERSSVAAACLDNALYALGGYDGTTSCLNTVERFDPEANSWTQVAPMNVRRSMHCAAVVSSRLFVVGGYDGSADLASCEVFNAEAGGSWELIGAMSSPRCMAGIGVLGDRLFVVGGCDCSQSLSSVEVYLEEEGAWQLVGGMSEPRSGHGVCVVGKKMYALGGYMGGAYSSSIECYEQESNSWSVVGSMDAEKRRFGCCS